MIYSFLGLKKPGVKGQNQHKYPTNQLPIIGQTSFGKLVPIIGQASFSRLFLDMGGDFNFYGLSHQSSWDSQWQL